MQYALRAVVAVVTLLSVGNAKTTPVIGIENVDDARLNDRSDGSDSIMPQDANFSSVTADAPGVPIIRGPDLPSTRISVTPSNGGVLTAPVTQTGITKPYSFNMGSRFTFNALTGLLSSAVSTNFIGTSGAAFGTRTQLPRADLSPADTASELYAALIPASSFCKTGKYGVTSGVCSIRSAS